MTFVRRAVLCTSLISLAGFFLLLAFTTHWADSELWSLTLSRTLELNSETFAIVYKPVFHGLLHIPFLWDLQSIPTIHTARAVFVVVGGLLAGLTFWFALLMSGKRDTAGVAVLILMSCSFFLSQGFRLRSDLLAAVFQMSALCVFLREMRRVSSVRRGWNLGFGIAALHFLALTCTPKAIFHLAVNLGFYLCFLRGPQRAQALRILKVSVFAPAALFLALAAFRWREFLSAVEFFISSFGEGADHPGFFTIKGLFYVFRWVVENPIFVLLILAGTISWRSRRGSVTDSALNVAAAVAVSAILLHNDRISFYILSLLPVLAVFAAHAGTGMSFARRPRVGNTLVILLLLQGGFFFHRFLTENSNSVQEQSLRAMQGYLSAHADLKYLDSTAVLPRENQILFFVSPSHEGNRKILSQILRSRDLDLVFFSSRMAFYAQEVLSFLQANQYVDLGGGSFGKAVVHALPAPLTEITVPIEKLCRHRGRSEALFFYEGNSFMETRPMTSVSAVSGITADGRREAITAPASMDELRSKYVRAVIASEYPYVACTHLSPIRFPDGKSFAQIFDVDTNY